MSTTFTDLPQAHLYKSHGTGDSYHLESGKYIIPIAEDEPTDPETRASWKPYVEVQVHAPMMFRTVAMDTTKDGGPPQMPAMTDTGKFTFLSGSIFLHGPKLSSNGYTSTWQVEADQVYVVAGPASAELSSGLVMTSLPFPTETQKQLTQTYGNGQVPAEGAVTEAGSAAKACYAEAQTVSFTNPYYSYRGTTLYPAIFFSTSLVNGEVLLNGT